MQIRLGPAGNVTYVVTNSFMAIGLMADHWPSAPTPALRAARMECVSALEGGNPEDARMAFEAAAREAGILVAKAPLHLV